MKLFKTTSTRAKPVDREGLEQAALMAELHARMPEVADLIFHVPNGGHRVKAVAAKLKAQGVKAGMPDLVLPMARGGFFGLYIGRWRAGLGRVGRWLDCLGAMADAPAR
jgi:hypothetical protein